MDQLTCPGESKSDSLRLSDSQYCITDYRLLVCRWLYMLTITDSVQPFFFFFLCSSHENWVNAGYNSENCSPFAVHLSNLFVHLAVGIWFKTSSRITDLVFTYCYSVGHGSATQTTRRAHLLKTDRKINVSGSALFAKFNV